MMRSTDRLSAVIFSRDSSTWICRRRPPLTLTAATPATRSSRGDRVVLGDLAQRDRVVVALDAEAHDRQRGRVELEDGRRVGVFGQAAADAIDAGAHFVGGFVEVGAPGEVEADGGLAFAGGRVDLLEAGDGADRLLDRPRDRFLHLERADAGVVDADGDARAAAAPASGRPAGASSEIAPSSMMTPLIMNIVTGRLMAIRGMLMSRLVAAPRRW